MSFQRTFLAGVSLLGLVSAATPAIAQSASTPTASAGEEIVVTGTRTANRSRLDTLSAVDVIGTDDLRQIGSTELNQVLSVALPSFNFPRPSITDGTDSVRPATLRGLAPDQTLVLVNSKRRHATALVNINGSIGRGSSAVDLNAIPSVALSSVEVLRDGAAAQYGSDAIAGVINLRLREARQGGSVSVTYGKYITDVETTRLSRSEEDGDTYTVAGWAGLPLPNDGFLTVSAEYLDRDPTSRGDRDQRIDTPAQSPTGSLVTSRYGDPKIEQGTFYVNAGVPLKNDWELYGWAGFQSREANSAANPRLRSARSLTGSGASTVTVGAFADNNTQTVPNTPVGFLPLIAPEVTDTAIGAGVTGTANGWMADYSIVYGRNRVEYGVENSLNASIARASITPGNPIFGRPLQRSFDAGALEYTQLVGNADFSRTFGAETVTPVSVAFGFEYRREEYSIQAGEPASYAFGLGLNGQPIRVDSAGAVVLTGGSVVNGGSQGFPGLRPTDAGTDNRDAISGYVEIEANLMEKLRVSLAGRAEDYSDFGATLNGKFSGRYDFTPNFALRGSASSGFRAPSLQQASFTSQATNFVGGLPREILTLPASDPVSVALGATPLRAEESVNYTIGTVFRLGKFELTVDAYQIDITDRIVLSDNLGEQSIALVDAGVDALIATVRSGVDGARFFINGVDTTTEGVDVVGRYGLQTDSVGKFDFTVSANWNSTDVTRTPTTAPLSALANPPNLFPLNQVLTFEEGTPQEKYSVAVDWDISRYGVTARATQYGKVLVPQSNAAGNYFIDSAVIVNLEGRADIGPVQLSLGADNLLDEYPTQAPVRFNGVNINLNGPAAFSSFSPFGFSGRYVYGRVAYSW